MGSNDHHEVLVDDNDFRSKGRLSCEKNLHSRERLLEYKCKIKSREKAKHHISEDKTYKLAEP